MIERRRHLLAATWVILCAQTLAFALGTAQVCWEGEHTHAGVAAPECAMHHHTGSDASSTHHHAGANAQLMPHHSHGHTSASGGAVDDSPRMTCTCSDDVTAMFLGQ